MKFREKSVKLGFAFFFILLTSYVVAEWTVDYKYLKYSEDTQLYLNSKQRVYTGKRTAEEILLLEQRTSVNLRIKDGSIIEVTTELVSGDLDVDIFLVVSVNDTSRVISAYSMNINSSREHLLIKSAIKTPSIDRYIFTEYPVAVLFIIPVTGSGIISLHYETLHPAQELIYLCVITMLIGASFFIKNVFDLIKF